MSQFAVYHDNLTGVYPVPASTAIAVGDALYWDVANNVARPLALLADALTQPLNQRNAARFFIGFALDQRLAATATAGTMLVLHEGTVDAPCASTTWVVGDLVGAVEAASGIALENNVFAKVTADALAIGVCVEGRTNALLVKYHYSGKLATDLPAKMPVSAANIETLAGTKTLTVGDRRLQVLNPGGAGRNVVLPREAESAGLEFRVVNAATGVEILTIQASNGSTTVCTPTQNESAIVFYDGLTWRGIVGFSN